MNLYLGDYGADKYNLTLPAYKIMAALKAWNERHSSEQDNLCLYWRSNKEQYIWLFEAGLSRFMRQSIDDTLFCAFTDIAHISALPLKRLQYLVSSLANAFDRLGNSEVLIVETHGIVFTESYGYNLVPYMYHFGESEG